jgi:hypothetical protein
MWSTIFLDPNVCVNTSDQVPSHTVQAQGLRMAKRAMQFLVLFIRTLRTVGQMVSIDTATITTKMAGL